MTTVTYSNVEKAAAFLVSLGIDRAAAVLSHLDYEEVQVIARQMAHIRKIPGEQRRVLLEELQQRCGSVGIGAADGGYSFLQRLLAETFGEERAMLVLDQLSQTKAMRPFSSLRAVDPHRILDILAGENPGVIALVLYYLPRDKSAQVLAGLPDALRHEVVMRMVNLKTPQQQIVARLEQILSQKLSDTRGDDEDGERDIGTVTGARALVEILGRADPNVERRVYEFLQERDPVLAEEVRKSMFVFEDVSRLDARSMQLVLRELSSQEIALSLKSATEEIRNLVFSNVSENAAKSIREELELLGPVRVSQVEEAQQKVVSTVRRMVDAGTITLQLGEEEELIA